MRPVLLRQFKLIMKRYLIILTAALMCCCSQAHAQKVAAGTNAVDWMYLVTPNVSLHYATGQHWSVGAAARYNAWSWNTRGEADERSVSEVKARQQTWSAGARWWPWNVYSGWWLEGRAQYQEYDNGGLKSLPWISNTEAGDAYGVALAAGYSLQLTRHWDLEFGLGLWGGWKTYTVYACPWCGRMVDQGSKTFVLPDQAIISMLYIF